MSFDDCGYNVEWIVVVVISFILCYSIFLKLFSYFYFVIALYNEEEKTQNNQNHSPPNTKNNPQHPKYEKNKKPSHKKLKQKPMPPP